MVYFINNALLKARFFADFGAIWSAVQRGMSRVTLPKN